ncbi:MAG: hypothetical protein IT318_20255 [Anaerolineales bacterium]|nr:hypothetical protein [Anaerolineales bacterium]
MTQPNDAGEDVTVIGGFTLQHWSFWTWPDKEYTPIMAYIMFHRIVVRLGWQRSVIEGVQMWWTYLFFGDRVRAASADAASDAALHPHRWRLWRLFKALVPSRKWMA